MLLVSFYELSVWEVLMGLGFRWRDWDLRYSGARKARLLWTGGVDASSAVYYGK